MSLVAPACSSAVVTVVAVVVAAGGRGHGMRVVVHFAVVTVIHVCRDQTQTTHH